MRRLAGSAVRSIERRVFPSAGTDTDRHWQRQAMNSSVEAAFAALPIATLDAVEISGDLHDHRQWRSYTSLAYPDFDICAPLTEERRFDYVICEQVLEHVEDPWGAVENLRELCRPGGRLLISTPFLIKVHEFPAYGMLDYWRFTPRGMRALLERSGLKVESVESWGNRECVLGNFTDWAAYERWMSLRNEPDFPVQVWAFARRPQAG